MGSDLLPRATLQQYDLRKDVWAQLPPLSVPRYDANIQLLANKVYVAGGRQCKRPIKAFEVYDLETRCWTPLPSMPCKRSYCGVLWDSGGRLCVLGGLRQGGGHQSSKFTRNVNIFDPSQAGVPSLCPRGLGPGLPGARSPWGPVSLGPGPPVGAWLKSEDTLAMKTKRADFAAAFLRGRMVVAGGLVEAFHPQKKKWERLAPMSVPRCSASSLVIRDRLLVVGGVNQVPSTAHEILYVKEEEFL
ncbi:hypothetical protein NHX12_031064 [Muraenolepis orangiensis]|uniref:Kelch domain-containing protein 8A n=1 Tax=Muraenolepis orangiensis TaxID=630683 RepID=A0A9Q0E8V8_9TELE|nr:hypothetical protein NHX12_031064 [Muraenolepis orangiensis]